MERNKTGVVVLFILAGFFFIAIAMIFNTTTRRNVALQKQADVEEKIKALNAIDLTVYWVGDVPKELESLKPSMNIIKPEEITKDNMPIKASTFHITVKDESGKEEEVVPRNYSEYMLLVINTGKGFSDSAKEILHNCIADNGVPVLCIGSEACNLVGTVLIHGAGYSKDYSIFYKLKEGYTEPFLDAAAVSEGGAVFADELCTRLCSYFNAAAAKKYAEAFARVSSAISSQDEAMTATTESEETSETAESSESGETVESGETAESAENSSSETQRINLE